jgi:membrane peptidoglycan carboxypeptidase
VYEGLATGQIWSFPGEAMGPAGITAVGAPPSTSLLISEIRDVEDRIIYRALPAAAPAVPPEVPAMTADILRHVVDWGTGRRARGVVTLGGAPVLLGGKTGTTNDFKNAAFAGFASVAGSVEPSTAWTLAVYVGYDDNRPMVSGGIKLAGASGALPAWLYTVQGMVVSGLLGDPGARAPDGGWRWRDPEMCVRVKVDSLTGRPAGDGAEGPMLLDRKAAAPAVVSAALPAEAGPRPVRIAPPAGGTGAEGGAGIWSQFKKRQAAEPTPKPSP